MVAGAAGMVCPALVDMFIRHNETSDGKVTIYAAGRWFDEVESRFDEYARRDYFRLVEYDASKSANKIIVDADYVVHRASNAHPSAIANWPVETMLSNFIGVQQLFEQSRRAGRNLRLPYISSNEVYGKVGGGHALEETENGYADLMNPRNSYSVGKRAAETLCVSSAAEYGLDCVIARSGHICGPTASAHDNRVASAWTRAAECGESILMKSDGRQLYGWCHCLDCASTLLAIMLKGESGSAYNISNPSSVGTIADLAECVAKVGGWM